MLPSRMMPCNRMSFYSSLCAPWYLLVASNGGANRYCCYFFLHSYFSCASNTIAELIVYLKRSNPIDILTIDELQD